MPMYLKLPLCIQLQGQNQLLEVINQNKVVTNDLFLIAIYKKLLRNYLFLV